jgi:hypothetical protein
VTYSINVKVRDGAVTETVAGGDVPDGTYSINGHSDGYGQSISVAQYGPVDSGVGLVATASSYHKFLEPTAD